MEAKFPWVSCGHTTHKSHDTHTLESPGGESPVNWKEVMFALVISFIVLHDLDEIMGQDMERKGSCFLCLSCIYIGMVFCIWVWGMLGVLAAWVVFCWDNVHYVPKSSPASGIAPVHPQLCYNAQDTRQVQAKTTAHQGDTCVTKKDSNADIHVEALTQTACKEMGDTGCL